MNGTVAELEEDHSLKNGLYPKDITPFEHQVAGHSSENGKSPLGLLKNGDGYVLKPIIKSVQGNREKKFYSDLQLATDAESIELRSFVPEYLGSSVLTIDGKDVEFLTLKDITQNFVEPCVMDIKIGKQTWDPEATPEKRQHEDQKYMQTKQELSFCIPGFQVHNIASGKLVRVEKDYGKMLTKHTTKDALKLFLNADCGLSRRLLLQLLAHLWRILRWCRSQRKYRFYSSSLLIVYDAKRLRQCLKTESPSSSGTRSSNLCISNSINASSQGSLAYNEPRLLPLRNNGEMCPRSQTPSRSGSCSPVTSPSTPTSNQQKQNSVFGFDSWHATFDKVCLSRTHSFVNNYEKDLEDMKDAYSFQLDDLMRSDKPGDKEMWLTVKMIDFAHTFPALYDEEDLNYLKGIENLVKMIEELMEEATC